MHGPDGADYPNRIAYHEIEPPARMSFTLSDDVEEGGESFAVTVTFDDIGGRPRVTMASVFPSAEDMRRHIEEYGAIEGGNQTLARLAAYLATTA
jgi:uncharacterized protein YndB with AHSA1/START domain